MIANEKNIWTSPELVKSNRHYSLQSTASPGQALNLNKLPDYKDGRIVVLSQTSLGAGHFAGSQA
ncbi:MAG: hypothetical protein ACOCPS_08190, partial [Desulfonatronovibrio sp.]